MKRFSRSEILVTLTFWSLLLSAYENRAKVPISNTNFSNKVSTSESYHKNEPLSKSLKLLCSLNVKGGPFNI